MDDDHDTALDELLDSARSDELREFVGGERDSLTANAGGDEANGSDSEKASSNERVDDDATPGTSVAAPSGGIARVLLKELREGYVDSETKAQLRAELEPGRSRDVKIKHLQQQVGDFAAYAETLEEFIDEHGPMDVAFDEVRSDVRTLDDRAESARSSIEELSEELERVDGLESNLDALGDDHDDAEARIESIERELERVDERLDDLEAFQARLSGVFQDMGVDQSE